MSEKWAFFQVYPRLNEEDWASEEESIPYEKSKLMAERAAWELVKNLPGQAQY